MFRHKIKQPQLLLDGWRFFKISSTKVFAIATSFVYTIYIIQNNTPEDSSSYWQALSYTYLSSIILRFGRDLQAYQTSVNEHCEKDIYLFVSTPVILATIISPILYIIGHLFNSLIITNFLFFSLIPSVFFSVCFIIAEHLKGRQQFHISQILYAPLYQVFFMLIDALNNDLLTSHLAASLVSCAVSILFIARKRVFFRKNYLTQIIPYKYTLQAIPLVLLTSCHQLITWSGTIFLGYFSLHEEVNTFQLAIRFFGIYVFLANTVDNLYAPQLINLPTKTKVRSSRIIPRAIFLCMSSYAAITITIIGLMQADILPMPVSQYISMNDIYLMALASMVMGTTPLGTNYLLVNRLDGVALVNIILCVTFMVIFFSGISYYQPTTHTLTLVNYLATTLLYRLLNYTYFTCKIRSHNS